MTLHVDIGGEGRHPGAINVNPMDVTSTTGAPGRPIPNLLRGRGEALPLASGIADVITIENAPIRAETADEIVRVLRPGGIVRLVHPSGYAELAHDAIAGAFGVQLAARSTRLLADGTSMTILRHAVDLLR